MGNCKAEYHSADGKDSLPFSSHTMFCLLEEGHEGSHQFYGGFEYDHDDRYDCKCPRCITKQQNGCD